MPEHGRSYDCAGLSFGPALSGSLPLVTGWAQPTASLAAAARIRKALSGEAFIDPELGLSVPAGGAR